MTFKPLPRIVNGAHIGQTRSSRHDASGQRGSARPSSPASASRQPDTLPGGTSLVQLSIPRAKRRQVIFDATPESQAAARVEAGYEEASAWPAASIPTPFGRRKVPAKRCSPQQRLVEAPVAKREHAVVLDDLLPCSDSQRP